MIYEAICTHCHKEHEYISSVADRNNTPVCCGEPTLKFIGTAPQVGALSSKYDVSNINVGGKNIGSGSDYIKAIGNKYIVGDDGHKEAERNKKYKQEKKDKKRREDVAKVVREMTA